MASLPCVTVAEARLLEVLRGLAQSDADKSGEHDQE